MIPTLTLKGDKRAKAMIKALMKLQTAVTGAGLHGKGRVDSNTNNASIAEGFIKLHKRDFFNTQNVADAAAEAFARAAEQRITKMKPGQKATGVAMYAWRQGMKAAMAEVIKNINNAKWDGGGKNYLSDDYGDWKEMKLGFTLPIGKATGQLIKNFDKSNVGNITLYKREK